MKQKFIIGDKVVVKNPSNKEQNLLVGKVVYIASISRKRYLVSFSDGIQKWYLSYQLYKYHQYPRPKFRAGDFVLVNAGLSKGCVGKTSAPFFNAKDEIMYQVNFVPNSIRKFGFASETLPEKWLSPFTGQTNEQLIQEAKDFAAEYFKNRNECVGKDWVDNVTDSWIYDSEDFWLTKYHWKHGEDKNPSEEERKAHWDESFRLFNKQYAELFAERDTELILKDFVQERLKACKKALDEITKLEQNSDSVKVRNAKIMLSYVCDEDKYLADYYVRDVNDDGFMRFIKNITNMKTRK